MRVYTRTLTEVIRRANISQRRRAHTERKVNVAGTDINIVETGEGAKSVLLMPGTLGSAWTDFRPQVEQLPSLLPGYRIVAWDPPGYGKSIPPKRQFDLNIFNRDAEAAVALMESLGSPKFSVLGWSGGAITAMALAGRFVENVDKLVIWGSGCYLNADEVRGWQEKRDVRELSPRICQDMERLYNEEFPKMWADYVDLLVEFMKERNGDFCRREADNIQAPTFILHGRRDPVIAAEPIAYLRQHIKRNKYYEFPDGKHNIHLRYAKEFNQLVAEFLLQDE